MAGSKSPRTRDDKNKKRKRESIDTEAKTKRHRQQDRRNKVDGDNGKTEGKPQQSMPESNGVSNEITGFRPQEIVRQSDDGAAGWSISKPMGGRMLDIDPILTEDEQYLILTYNTSIQIYTAADSLLVRRIPISTLDTTAPQGSTPAHIVASRLSKSDSSFVWIACSDGQVYRVNWTESRRPTPVFQTASRTAKAMTVVAAAYAEYKELAIVAESDKQNRMELTAYQVVDGKPSSKSLLTLKGSSDVGLHILESSIDGRYIVGAFQDRLFLGSSSADSNSVDQLDYNFISFDAPDLVTTLDMRTSSKSHSGNKKVQLQTSDSVIDLVVGGARGSIYVYNDAMNTTKTLAKPSSSKEGIQVQKYHWHRKAVHAVKWSRDGHYFISGGSENVLVIWQVDTSKKEFLPHLSGSVENIVVSSSGASYAIHLDDNSAMILSTSELKPTTYIAGIQSAAIDLVTPKDLLVRRVWSTPEQVQRPIPAAVSPLDPAKLHVCVGNGRQATLSGDFSAPLLQSFDLETFSSVSTQALARTQPTDVNITNKGYPIDEPLVTHIAFSGDGRWLASVDEWEPASRDVDNVSSDLRDQFIRERHEIYLKFWQAGEGAESAALVSRINAPHATNSPESILDLAADPVSSCFATIGSDGSVRVWRPRVRQNSGIVVKDASGQDAVSWVCSQVIHVGDGTGLGNHTDLINPDSPVKAQGSLSFSEDGSTLFAAFGAVDSGIVYVIDVTSGNIVKTLEGLWEGKLQSVRTLASSVIVLANDLRVYDVVSDELRYGIVVPKIAGVTELLQLAVDHTSGHFAVTLPIGGVSSIGVFDPEEPEPLLVRSTPHRIVSLVSAPRTSGFIALDDAAQVWVIAEGSDPSSFATVQPLEDLKLGDSSVQAEDGSSGEALINGEDVDMASEDELEEAAGGNEDVDMDDDDDDDDNEISASVIPQQALTDIFDAAPAFAAPSVEDLFYKVTGLLATKPLSSP